MKTEKGLFIVLDGGEGSGKTTLIKKAMGYYGNELVITREPGGSPFAEAVREVIFNGPNAKNVNPLAMFHLYWAARVAHMEDTIIKALNDGKILICDRFDCSTFAYQIAASGARHLEKVFWRTRDFYKEVYPGKYEPDLYVYLDLDPKIGLTRKKAQKDCQKNYNDEKPISFHQDVRAGFKEFFSHKDQGIKSLVINAEESEEEVFEDLKKIIFSLKAV